MQSKTWTLQLADGRTYPGLSGEEARIALARLVYGIEPVGEPAVLEIARPAIPEGIDTPLAA